MFSHSLIHILPALFLALQAVSAREGANTFACLFLPDFPVGALDLAVHFEAGFSSQCMRSPGHATNMLVKHPGTTCQSIGYVEAEDTGSCRGQISMMNVSYVYQTGDQRRSGMTRTWWDTATEPAGGGGEDAGGGELEWVNAMKLLGQSGDAVACTSEKLCRVPRRGRWSVTWRQGSKGPVYIIFKP